MAASNRSVLHARLRQYGVQRESFTDCYQAGGSEQQTKTFVCPPGVLDSYSVSRNVGTSMQERDYGQKRSGSDAQLTL